MNNGPLREGAMNAWGERWRSLLTASGASGARRVQRGQALFRRGVVEELRLDPGHIRATVVEDRVAPCEVELRWPTAPTAAWDRAVEGLRSELRFTAALLEGRLPDELADALDEVGIRLLPAWTELETACSCGDEVKLCRHAAAVYTAAGALVERDPVLLLGLGGRAHDELLRALRNDEAAPGAFVDASIDLSLGLDAAHGDLEPIELRPAPVDDPAGLLRHLGDPPGVDDPVPLARLVERAAAAAWRLAAGDGAAAADEELLLAELRAQRVASAASLAGALGRDPAAVTSELDRLYEAGMVMRTGAGERARYRAGAS